MSIRNTVVRSLAVLLLCSGGSVLAGEPSPPADLILSNGEIYTPGGWAEAVAVKDGLILAVGTTAEVEKHRGAATRSLDLAGATVFPGLHDSHAHPFRAGHESFDCKLTPGAKPQEIRSAVAKCVQAQTPGAWVQGGNWVGAVFGPGEQNKAFLDAVAPQNPLVLHDEAHHSVWVNSAALRLANITKDTPDPAGGVIERDAEGEPTGLLRETAARLVTSVIPAPSAERDVEALGWAFDHMLSYGITAVTDAGAGDASLAAYRALDQAGRLKQHVKVCISWMPPSQADLVVTEARIDRRNFYASERVATDCVKIYLDGVPIEGRTARMLEPYLPSSDHDHGHDNGMLMVPAHMLNEVVTRLDAQGLVVKMHAAGDGAVRAGLDAIEAARRANGFSGKLHDIGHNTFVAEADVGRARGLAATFEISPYIWFPTLITNVDIRRVVGDARMERVWPNRELVDAGGLVVIGSDWPVVPSPNPWLAIETLVTRQVPGGGGQTLGPRQALTLEQAFDLFTVNAAIQEGRRDKVGAIERGLAADFVVVARNPFKVPVTEIHKTTVLMTLIGGEIVYQP